MRRRRTFGKRPRSYTSRKPVGYYKDRKGRTHPIMGRGRPNPPIIVSDWPPIRSSSAPTRSIVKVTLPIAEYAFGALACNSPFIGQVYTTIQVAKLAYQYCTKISDLSRAYDREGWGGVVKVAGKQMAMNYLPSAQASIFWGVIKDKIQPSYSTIAREIVEMAVEKLTDEEMDYVDRWLSKN